MPEFERLLSAITTRTRRTRALSAFGLALLIGSGSLLCVVIVCHLLRTPIALRLPFGLGMAAVSSLSALLVAILAGSKPVDLARLLLGLDTRLEAHARLSSLYELHRTHGNRVFQEALSPLVMQRKSEYLEALRIRRAHVGAIAVGAVFIVLLAGSPWLGSVLWATASEPVAMSGEPRGAEATAEEGVVAEPEDEPVLEATPPSPDAGSSAGLLLDDVLGDLRSSRGADPEEPIDEDALTASEPSGTIQLEEEEASSLRDLLAAISERIRQTRSGELSEGERAAISEIVSEASDPLASDLEGLLGESDPDQARERIERLLSTTESFPETDESEAPPGIEADAESLDAPSEREPSTSRDTSEDQTTGGEDAPDAYPISDFDSGKEGLPELVEAQLPGEFGDTGGFVEYITKGVPVEPQESEAAEPASFVVDYERMESILDARSIPGNAYEVVRTYFELITEGGP